MEWQAVVALVLGMAIVLFVPALMCALVWATIIAGVYQVVREKVRQKRSRSDFHPLPTRVGW